MMSPSRSYILSVKTDTPSILATLPIEYTGVSASIVASPSACLIIFISDSHKCQEICQSAYEQTLVKFTDSEDTDSQPQEDSQNWFSGIASVNAISRIDKGGDGGIAARQAEHIGCAHLEAQIDIRDISEM